MAETVSMPKLGFDMAEGTLVRWVKSEGETVGKGDVLAEIETDKATVEVESSFEGIVYKHLVEEKAIVPVGTPIAVISAPGEEVKYIPSGETSPVPAREDKELPAAVQASPKSQADTDTDGRIKASPLAKRMAEENHLDLANLRGSGPGGRVVKKDIEAALVVQKTAKPDVALEKEQRSSIPASAWGSGQVPADERVSLNKLRQAIARRMVESKQSVPHFYLTYEVNAAPLLDLRKQVNNLLPDDEKTSVNDFIIKAAAVALRSYPNLNASLQGNEVLRHGHINIGVAVAIEGGLLTIVSRDADLKPVRDIPRKGSPLVTQFT